MIYISLAGFVYLAARRYIFTGFKLPNDWGTGVVDITLLYYSLLFRSLPTLLANYFVVFCIRPIDSNMRFIQPFVNMFETPESATNTILLAYSTMAPLEVPLKAYDNGHYKVCWYSALSTASPLFPIFIGGLLTMTSQDNDVHFQFSLPAVLGTTVFLFVYCISLPIAWPQMHRLLPRRFWSMADLMAMCHESHLLKSADMQISDPKMSKERMNARILLNDSRFLFGVYEGLDGKPHVGFDVVSREEGDLPAGSVQWISPRRSKTHRFYWRFSGRGREHGRKQSQATDTEMAHVDKQGRPGHHRNASGADIGVDEDEEEGSSAVDERYMASGAL